MMQAHRQYLKHGKALCGNVFGGFVETFNWIVDFCSNVKGDNDVRQGAGKIVVDRTDARHPVIRCTGCDRSTSDASSSSTPTAFRLVASGGVFSVVSNVFFWDGEQKTLSDYVVPVGSGTVYLVAKQAAPSSSGEGAWTFELCNALGQEPQGGRVVNFKLYDLDANGATCDYRATFMALSSPHAVSQLTVEKPDDDNHPTVVLSACNSNDAEMTLTDSTGDNTVEALAGATECSITAALDTSAVKASAESGGASVEMSFGSKSATIEAGSSSASLVLDGGVHSATIDTADLEKGNAEFHKLTVNHSDGSSDEYDVLASSDITINESSGGEGGSSAEVLQDVTLNYSAYQLTMTKTFINLGTGTTRTVGPTTIFTAVAHSDN